MQLATIKYQVATYSGTVEVNCLEDDDTEHIIAKARGKLKRLSGGSLPFGYQSFEIIERKTIY